MVDVRHTRPQTSYLMQLQSNNGNDDHPHHQPPPHGRPHTTGVPTKSMMPLSQSYPQPTTVSSTSFAASLQILQRNEGIGALNRLPKGLQQMLRLQSPAHKAFSNMADTSASSARNLMVQGLQTGETVLVQPTEIRQASDDRTLLVSSSHKRLENARRASEKLEVDRKEKLKHAQNVRRLENEIKRLKELIEKRDAEIARLKAKLAEIDADIEKEKKMKDEEAYQMKLKIDQKRAETELARKRIEDIQAEMDGIRKAMEKEREDARIREQDLQKIIADLKGKAQELGVKVEQTEKKEAMMETTKKENEQQRSEQVVKMREAIQAERAKLEELETQRNEKRNLLLRSEAELMNYKDKIKQYGIFMQKICGSVPPPAGSDTPVNPAMFKVVEGHALVPLVLLLEGYSFLPENMRDTKNQTIYNPPTAQSLAQKRRKSLPT